jgi:hypothetical protein
MQLHKIASQSLLILSTFNFVLAAPVAVREINEVRAVNAVDVAKVGMVTSEKRMDPGGQSSTASSSSTSSDSDTATSRQPLSTGSHPGPAGNPSPSYSVSTDYSPPSHWVSTDNPSPSYSVSTDDVSPSYSVSTDYAPPSTDYSPPSRWVSTDNPSPSYSVSTDYSPPSYLVSTDGLSPSYSGSTDYSPPSQSVSTTDDRSPPSTEPQHPGAPESDFFDKLMKGKFKRRISGHGPGNVVQREFKLQGAGDGPSAYGEYVSTLSLPLLPNVETTRVTKNILIFLCPIVLGILTKIIEITILRPPQAVASQARSTCRHTLSQKKIPRRPPKPREIGAAWSCQFKGRR